MPFASLSSSSRSMLTLTFFISLSLAGCGGGGGDSDSDDGSKMENTAEAPSGESDNSSGGISELSTTPKHIDITGARSLIITGDYERAGPASVQGMAVNQNGGDQLDPGSLYKIDENGTMSRVTVDDEEGYEIPASRLRPHAVRQLSHEFTLIALSTNPANEFPGTDELVNALVDNATGVVYDGSELPAPFGIKWVDTHDNGLYIAAWDASAPPLFMERTDEGGLKASTLPSGPEQIATLAGDAKGTFVTFSGDQVRRFVSLNTEEPVLSTVNLIPGAYWSDGQQKSVSLFTVKGEDGNVYLMDQRQWWEQGYELAATVFKLGVDAEGKPVFEEVDIAVEGEMPSGIDATWGVRKVTVAGRQLYIGSSEDIFKDPIEVDLEGRRIFTHGLDQHLDPYSVSWVDVSSNYLWYLATSPVTLESEVLRYNPATRELISFGSGGLEITEMQIVSEDKVLVTGFSTAHQGDVTGYLSADKSFEIDDIFNRFKQNIIQIEPLY